MSAIDMLGVFVVTFAMLMVCMLFLRGMLAIGHKLVPLLMVLLVLLVVGGAVAGAEWRLARWLGPAFPPARPVPVGPVLVGLDVVAVGWWAYRWSPLRVRVRHRRAARLLRGTPVAGQVHAVVRGRITRIHPPRSRAGAGLAGGLEWVRQDRAGRPGERLDLLVVGGRLVVARRASGGYESVTVILAEHVEHVMMRREGWSVYRFVHSTPYDADRVVVAQGLVSEDFAIVLTDGSSVMVTGGPPEEIDRLRRLTTARMTRDLLA